MMLLDGATRRVRRLETSPTRALRLFLGGIALMEYLNREIKRRTDVVGIFPNEAAILRLAGAVLLEVHDEWATAERRYLAEGSMARLDPGRDDQQVREVERAKTVLLAS